MIPRSSEGTSFTETFSPGLKSFLASSRLELLTDIFSLNPGFVRIDFLILVVQIVMHVFVPVLMRAACALRGSGARFCCVVDVFLENRF